MSPSQTAQSKPLPPRLALLLHAPPGRVLWRLATPNVLTAALMVSVPIADAWFVGQLGTAALASLALVFPLQSLMLMMAGGAIGGGTASAVARALGAGDQEAAEAAAWHAVLIGLVMAGIYMIVLGYFARPMFAMFGAKADVLDGAVAYSHIAFGGAASVWALQVCFAILRGSGDTTTPARAVLGSSILQVFLSGALTLGWGPFPKLGVTGPAVAIVIAMAAGAAYMACQLVRDGGSSQRVLRLHPVKLAWRPLRSIMQVGAIGLINSLTIAFTVVVVTRLIAEYGTAALAGYGVGSRLELLLTPLVFGIGGALTGAVGANVGAKQHGRARRLAWTGAAVAGLATGALGITVSIWPSLWLNLFTADAGTYAMGSLYLLIAGPFFGMFGAGQTLYFASQGTGRMGMPVLVGILRFACAAGGGLLAVSIGAPVEWLFASVAAGLAITGIGLGVCVRYAPGWRGT
jgi:putative MATE family efflux protein